MTASRTPAGPGRPHGSRDKYSHERCRCGACRGAWRAYAQRRGRLIAYGRWQPFIDAKPVREHVRALMTDGLSRRALADLAGVSESTISGLLYGCGHRDRPPSRRITLKAGERLLALRPCLDDYPDRALIDATGTRRRLQALSAAGWSTRQIGERVGIKATWILYRERVLAATARAIRDVYDDLWDQAPPQRTPAERISVAVTLARADKAGWPPPMAWDDEAIDDPAAVPDLGERTPRTLALAENAAELLRQGFTLAQAADRLGVTKAVLQKARERARQKAVA